MHLAVELKKNSRKAYQLNDSETVRMAIRLTIYGGKKRFTTRLYVAKLINQQVFEKVATNLIENIVFHRWGECLCCVILNGSERENREPSSNTSCVQHIHLRENTLERYINQFLLFQPQLWFK